MDTAVTPERTSQPAKKKHRRSGNKKKNPTSFEDELWQQVEAELAQQVFVAGEPVIGSQIFDAEDKEEAMRWAPGIIDRVRSDGQLEVSNVREASIL